MLIERNLHGDTVEAAATTLFRESLGANSFEAGPPADGWCRRSTWTCRNWSHRRSRMTGHAIDHDERFHSLADALTSLMLLERYAAYRGHGKAAAGGTDLADVSTGRVLR